MSNKVSNEVSNEVSNKVTDKVSNEVSNKVSNKVTDKVTLYKDMGREQRLEYLREQQDLITLQMENLQKADAESVKTASFEITQVLKTIPKNVLKSSLLLGSITIENEGITFILQSTTAITKSSMSVKNFSTPRAKNKAVNIEGTWQLFESWNSACDSLKIERKGSSGRVALLQHGFPVRDSHE